MARVVVTLSGDFQGFRLQRREIMLLGGRRRPVKASNRAKCHCEGEFRPRNLLFLGGSEKQIPACRGQASLRSLPASAQAG